MVTEMDNPPIPQNICRDQQSTVEPLGQLDLGRVESIAVERKLALGIDTLLAFKVAWRTWS